MNNIAYDDNKTVAIHVDDNCGLPKEQIGESYSFDFEKNEWTFKMPDGFICSTGKFKITPILNNQKPNE